MVRNSVKMHEETPRWTADKFIAEATKMVGSIITGDVENLNRLTDEYQQARLQQREVAKLPIDPWKDPAVAYGALLALSEISDVATRTIISPTVLRDILRSSEAQRILLSMAKRPGGSIEKSEIPNLTAIHRSNAQPKLEELKDMGLLSFSSPDPNNTSYTLELTNDGWSVVDLLRVWKLDESLEPSIKGLLNVQVSIADLVEKAKTIEPFELGKLVAEETIHIKRISKAIEKVLESEENKQKYAVNIIEGIESTTGRSRRKSQRLMEVELTAKTKIFDRIEGLPNKYKLLKGAFMKQLKHTAG